MEFSKEQIEIYKKQYGSIFKYTTDDGKSCVLKAPTIELLEACATRGSGIDFKICLLENSWIAGDNEIKTVDKYKLGVINKLSKIIQVINGEMEEL